MESHLIHLLEHLHGILETILRELVVTLPIHVKPSRIEVYHVRRDIVLAQLISDFHSFLLREIRDTTHPCAECPERQHRRFSRYFGIFIQDVLGFTEEDEIIHRLITHE